MHATVPVQTAFIVAGTVARFHIQRDPGSGVYPDWTLAVGRRTRKIPGSSQSVTWFDGWGLATITLAIRCDDRAAYRMLLTMTGQTGDLHLLARFTSHEGDCYHHPVDGRDYERYADTTLIDAPQDVRHLIGGAVACEVTFARAYAPVFTPAPALVPMSEPGGPPDRA